jgi:hypothetical protein
MNDGSGDRQAPFIRAGEPRQFRFRLARAVARPSAPFSATSRVAAPRRRDPAGAVATARRNNDYAPTPEYATCNARSVARRKRMASSTVVRVRKRRAALRQAGLRPVQIWVPDTRRPGFAEECRRQSRLVAEADLADGDLGEFLNAALADVDGWRGP